MRSRSAAHSQFSFAFIIDFRYSRFMTEIGLKLRSARVNAQLTQAELAQRLGMDSRAGQLVVSRWERGVTKGPHPELLGEVCRVLNCEVAELLELQDERASA